MKTQPLPFALRHEFRMGNTGDPWGRVMSWSFALADYMIHRDIPVPASWRFRQSPFGPDRTSWEWKALAWRNDSPATLARFARALERLRRACEQAGRDY